VAGIKMQLQPTFLIPQNIPMGWLWISVIFAINAPAAPSAPIPLRDTTPKNLVVKRRFIRRLFKKHEKTA
jgi:hypothetical protein